MSEEGKLLLNDSGMNVIGEDSLQEASKRIVELVR
jgi:succinyl-CoA synthetase beta subunit